MCTWIATQSSSVLSANPSLGPGLILRHLVIGNRKERGSRIEEEPKSVGSGFRLLGFQFWL